MSKLLYRKWIDAKSYLVQKNPNFPEVDQLRIRIENRVRIKLFRCQVPDINLFWVEAEG